MQTLFSNLRLHFILLAIFGGLYPIFILGIGKAVPHLAAGQPIARDGKIIGFANIGQANNSPLYFHPRPSAVSHNAASTGGSNKGPTNPAYLATVRERAALLRIEHGAALGTPVPADLVTASGSGIDPDISPDGALYQAARVAKARNLPLAKVQSLIAAHTATPFFGPAYVRVLPLNLALDNLK